MKLEDLKALKTMMKTFAGSDKTLPAFMSVRIFARNGHVEFSASDRFKVGIYSFQSNIADMDMAISSCKENIKTITTAINSKQKEFSLKKTNDVLCIDSMVLNMSKWQPIDCEKALPRGKAVIEFDFNLESFKDAYELFNSGKSDIHIATIEYYGDNLPIKIRHIDGKSIAVCSVIKQEY